MALPVYQIRNEFDCENLLNNFSQFNEFYPWNKVVNPSGATIFNLFNRKFSGKNSCEITFSNAMPIEFNAGNNKMQYVSTNTGMHTFRFSAFKNDNNADINFTIKLFIAGLNTPNTTFTANLFDSSGFVNGRWNSYWFEVYLIDGQILDFSFIAQSDTAGSKLYIDGLKLSLKDRSIPNSVPFTEPLIKDYFQEFDITLPLLQPGEKFLITAGFILGSEKGDFVKLAIICPSPFQPNFHNLFFSQPYVRNGISDPDYVSNINFVIKNENTVAFQANLFTVRLLIQK